MSERLGFIGLGAMGQPMAMHLLRAGHALSVYARRAEALAPFADAGARVCASPAAVGTGASVVFTMVTNAQDVEEIVLGPNGVKHGLQHGGVVVDMETISPLAARRIAGELAAHGIDMLDAPVSGGPGGAQAATLSIMVGGRSEVFERVRPLLALMGKTITHMGDSGAGQATKACNQLALTVTLQGVAEALTLARSYGVDAGKVRQALLGGAAASRVLELFGQRMVDRNFADGIEARLYHKDLHIVLELAHELGLSLPAGALAKQSFNALVGSGAGKSDAAALIELMDRLSRSKEA
jgi:2-hydroxy-3-oxopropionate reductase